MKKTSLIIFPLLLLVLLTSCNMDATEGIYQSVMNSQTTETEPISQIINYDKTSKTVLMLSSNGILKYDGNTGTYTTLVSPKQVPHISRAYLYGADVIHFTNSVVESDNTVTIQYHKYDMTTSTISDDTPLPDEQSINYASSTGKVYLDDSTAHQIIDKETNSPILDYSPYVTTAKNYGIEVRDEVTRLFVTKEDEPSGDDYYCLNFLTESGTMINGLPSNKWVVTGAITVDSDTYITAFDNDSSNNSYQIVIYKVDTSTGKVEQFIKTGISARDFDLELGQLGGYVFFHVYGRSPLYYFEPNSAAGTTGTIKQTSMSNLTSTIDFVTILDSSEDEILLATSSKGFYKLTDVTKSSGFRRVSIL